MVRKILAALAGVALLGGLGFGAASLASASTSSSGLCAKNGTRSVTYFPGGCPTGSFAISGPVTVVAPAPVAATDPTAGETAATLSTDASIVATDTTVPLKWTGATPPLGSTIDHYTVRKRYASATATTWTTIGTVTVLHSVVAGLTAFTAYDFQVQAVYSSGVGPWSNTVSVVTKAA